MKWLSIAAALVVAGLAGCGGGSPPDDSPPNVQYLFLQSAASGTFVPSVDEADVYILKLNGVGENTTYFSDRPYRLTGIVSTADFIDSWNDPSDDGFLKDPPNAALQIDGATPSGDAIIVELVDVLYDKQAGALTYRTRIVHRATDSVELFHARNDPVVNIPASFGSASLFIDSWYGKVWHKVKDTANDIDDAAKRDAEKLKKAVSDFEDAVKATAADLDAMAKDPSRMAELTDDAFFRLVSVALPSSLSACVNVVPSPPVFPLYEQPAVDRSDWMAGLGGEISLVRLALPGSHDSGTYSINATSPLSTEPLAKGNNEYARLFLALSTVEKYFPVAYPLIAQLGTWSRAQGHTIKGQLAAGVRYLDLRLLPDPKNEKLHATHALLGAELDPMLQDVAAFLAAHPGEIVILDFQHLFSNTGGDGDMSGLVADALADKIIQSVGDKLAVSDSLPSFNSITLKDLRDKKAQVVAVFDSGPRGRMSADRQLKIWDAGVLNRYWPNKPEWTGDNGVKAYLDENIGTANGKNEVAVLQGQITSTPGLIGKRLVLAITIGTTKAQINCLRGTSGIAADLITSIDNHLERLTGIGVALGLQDAARDSNPELKRWVASNRPKHIVIADFIADYPELIQAIIDSNR